MVVYRRGNPTPDNLTPRPERDTIHRPGQAPGLSTFQKIELTIGQKALEIDTVELASPLGAIPDDPELGGEPRHVSIVPIDANGHVDNEALEEWASFRQTGKTHPYTQIVINAVTRVVRGTS